MFKSDPEEYRHLLVQKHFFSEMPLTIDELRTRVLFCQEQNGKFLSRKDLVLQVMSNSSDSAH